MNRRYQIRETRLQPAILRPNGRRRNSAQRLCLFPPSSGRGLPRGGAITSLCHEACPARIARASAG